MSHSVPKVIVGGLAIGALTVVGTSYILSLFPAPDASSREATEASFLAHLLLPLSVVLALVLAIVVVGVLLRLLAALTGSGRDTG